MVFIKTNLSFILLSILLLFGCKASEKKEQSEDYEVYVKQITRSFAKSVKKEFGLVCYATGGRMPYDVEEISIKFIAYQKATIEEARQLEIELTERLLAAINSHEKIRPFLREYPFKANRAEVAISFNKKDNTPYTDGSVAYVFQVKNIIHYCEEIASTNDLNILKEEPYEEALKLIKGNSPANLRGN